MLDYSPADFGTDAPEGDTTTHTCSCGQSGCPVCDPSATAPAWWQRQPLEGEDDTTDALPF